MGTTPPAAHFWLARPVRAGAPAISPAPWYTYGDTLAGRLRPHHGVEFPDPAGTDLVAVASGTVVVAGDDLTTTYGLEPDFYGNLVVLQLDQTYAGRPVFALYGHLSEVNVKQGARVKAGDLVGKVGASGIADGAHLHLEVRVDQNDYEHTRNPVLWLAPLPGTGVLAGRVTDAAGKPIPMAVVEIYRADTEDLVEDVATYALETIHGDDVLAENFTLHDLPAGDYYVQARVGRTIVSQSVTISAGQVAFVELQLGR